MYYISNIWRGILFPTHRPISTAGMVLDNTDMPLTLDCL